MDILGLKIDNFLTIGHANLELNNKGLVLLRGVNEDDPSASSNGSGKSTIPDAICWGLYGETARGESGDSVVNDTAKKNCRVIIDLRDGDTIYKIIRHRKYKEHKNATFVYSWTASEYGTGVEGIKLHKATEKETQEVINDILGCTLDVFMASIYAGQEAMPDLPKMKDKELKNLIEKASGVERLEKAYELARSKALTAKNDLEATATLITRIEGSRAGAFDRLKDAAAKYKEFEAGRGDRAAEHLKSIEEKQVEVKALNDKFAPLFASEGMLKAERDELATKLSSHRELNARYGELTREASAANGLFIRAQSEFDHKMRTVKAIKAQIDNAPEEMKKPCGECGKPHTEDELAEYVEHQTKRLREAAEDAKSAKSVMDDAKAKADKAKADADAFKATIPDVTEVSEAQSRANAALRQADEVRNKIAATEAEIARLKTISDTFMTAINPYKASVALLGDEIKKADAELDKLRTQLREKEEAHEIAKTVADVFGPAGVRAHILDTVTPFLNDHTGDYLGALSDGSISAIWSTLGETKGGDLREKFNIDVTNDRGGKSFGLLSGGEKRKVRLAAMLALQDLVASRAVKPINLWIGDEVDDALDVAGLERLMGIMERKARERGTVLVISHNDLSDWIDNQTVVTKKGGVSTVEGALCA
jgi:DNA repair exonuclease SbcCD ATPase subunit